MNRTLLAPFSSPSRSQPQRRLFRSKRQRAATARNTPASASDVSYGPRAMKKDAHARPVLPRPLISSFLRNPSIDCTCMSATPTIFATASTSWLTCPPAPWPIGGKRNGER